MRSMQDPMCDTKGLKPVSFILGRHKLGSRSVYCKHYFLFTLLQLWLHSWNERTDKSGSFVENDTISNYLFFRCMFAMQLFHLCKCICGIATSSRRCVKIENINIRYQYRMNRNQSEFSVLILMNSIGASEQITGGRKTRRKMTQFESSIHLWTMTIDWFATFLSEWLLHFRKIMPSALRKYGNRVCVHPTVEFKVHPVLKFKNGYYFYLRTTFSFNSSHHVEFVIYPILQFKMLTSFIWRSVSTIHNTMNS